MITKADAPEFIWLIVGIFWVVSQIAGAAAKKKQSLRTTDPGDANMRTLRGDPPAQRPTDGFAELLRKLGGEQPFEVPQPEYEELPEERDPEPVLLKQNAWRRDDIETLPDMEPLRREPPILEPVAQMKEATIRPTMKAFRNTLPAMKLPAMNMSFQGSETSARNVSNLEKIIDSSDRKSLRRAMLSHIIFSKPKAFEQ